MTRKTYTYKKDGLIDYYLIFRSLLLWAIIGVLLYKWLHPDSFWTSMLYVVIWAACGNLSNFLFARIRLFIKDKRPKKNRLEGE